MTCDPCGRDLPVTELPDQTIACLRDTPIGAGIFTGIGAVLALLLVTAGRGLF